LSGKYNGVQAKIKERNKFADYAPCAAHSLNPVGQSAASSCDVAVLFFTFLEHIFSFFSASTHRWHVLSTKLDEATLGLHENTDDVGLLRLQKIKTKKEKTGNLLLRNYPTHDGHVERMLLKLFAKGTIKFVTF